MPYEIASFYIDREIIILQGNASYTTFARLVSISDCRDQISNLNVPTTPLPRALCVLIPAFTSEIEHVNLMGNILYGVLEDSYNITQQLYLFEQPLLLPNITL